MKLVIFFAEVWQVMVITKEPPPPEFDYVKPVYLSVVIVLYPQLFV